MAYFLVFDVANDAFISNLVCGTRERANHFCDFLERTRKTEFIPVRCVDGKITDIFERGDHNKYQQLV